MCASGSIVNNLSGDTDESNVPIMIPEHANGSSKLKKAKDTTEVESNGCQSSIRVYMHASIRRVDG